MLLLLPAAAAGDVMVGLDLLFLLPLPSLLGLQWFIANFVFFLYHVTASGIRPPTNSDNSRHVGNSTIYSPSRSLPHCLLEGTFLSQIVELQIVYYSYVCKMGRRSEKGRTFVFIGIFEEVCGCVWREPARPRRGTSTGKYYNNKHKIEHDHGHDKQCRRHAYADRLC